MLTVRIIYPQGVFVKPLSPYIRRKDFIDCPEQSLGGADMTDTIDKRARELAEYVLETGATVRAAAERFGVSKSTVHKDLTRRLEQTDRLLWLRVRAVLDRNKAQRHLRGGEATRRKYETQNAKHKTQNAK